MGMTMTQKILAAHAGEASVKAGQLIQAKLDVVMGNDITTAVALKEFQKTGAKEVFDKDKVVIVLDHFTPNKDIKAAEQCKACRTFAYDMSVKNFFDVGQMGIEHALLPEKGIVVPGQVIIGADSHTCTYGALGAFSTGIGSTDMAIGMATGEAWFKVPSAIKFVLTGKPAKWVSGKDIILHIIGMIGVDGALYRSMEFVGDGIQYLTIDDRFSMANMAIEAGAKCALFTPDEKTAEYCEIELNDYQKSLFGDPDAAYCRVMEYNAEDFVPVMACPSQVDKIRNVSELEGTEIDQVFIGSCTNGRLEDLAAAAEVLKGKQVAKFVKLIVTPASRKIYRQAADLGILETLAEAGAMITHPGCGLCCGRAGGILTDGERVVATNNRNFLGRMGTSKVQIYLASPRTAAACAVAGKIVCPE